MKNYCVFDHEKECPVRKAMSNEHRAINKLDKVIQPIGDKEILKMYMPILDKMRETFHSEFQTLHYYCLVCKKNVEK